MQILLIAMIQEEKDGGAHKNTTFQKVAAKTHYIRNHTATLQWYCISDAPKTPTSTCLTCAQKNPLEHSQRNANFQNESKCTIMYQHQFRSKIVSLGLLGNGIPHRIRT